jgi:enoyl-CoA hydratase
VGDGSHEGGDRAAIRWAVTTLWGHAACRCRPPLLTSDFIDGREAERIGLVSIGLPADQVLPKAFEVATSWRPERSRRFAGPSAR